MYARLIFKRWYHAVSVGMKVARFGFGLRRILRHRHRRQGLHELENLKGSRVGFCENPVAESGYRC